MRNKIYIIIGTTLISFFLLIQYYYFNNHIETIKNEKNIILEELNSLKLKLSNVEYSVLVSPKNSIVKLGEKYSARIELSQSLTTDIPKLAVGVNKNPLSETLTDSLKYNQDYKCFVYSFSPKRVGLNSFVGKMIFLDYKNEKREIGFLYEIEVVK